ncbi:SusC/RagA family TonB-linked outer membrane protein [Algoriphagus machipongonensis]|uniref:Outer membrane protein, probably involved in nutrient binding n=1 Tax=Algoriphagus machipongonensis TaxID=388413 RepID=A3HZD0_9BACT|nr:TonB-dependent receptor [Algoriphagus machipongonensis]EAZ80616.1 putative outer membrane protein, probably involved in nutrient binding [Algoriphagus machipongonensis]
MFMKNVYKSLSALVLLLVLSSATVFAQKTVTGTVLDEYDVGLPGVSVLVKGTTTGTATDIDGNFSLNVPNDQAVLVFSFIGYNKVEQTVGNRSVIDVKLAPDETTLTELVVTGYTIDSRRETTGAIATVDPKDLTVIPTGNVEQALQGRVSGVTVITNGQPGTTSIIRVRGFGSFGGNEPLYVVDGVPVQSTDFINPDDIASTTVLKDAAAASIYGARASNGVIIYTTKRGRRGNQKLRVDYNGMFGVTTPGDGLDMMNPQDFANTTWLAETNQAIIDDRDPNYEHPQFGTGTSPVLPYYINVGGAAGVPGPFTAAQLEEERAKYNVDRNKGGVYQVVRAATGEGTDWYRELTRSAPLTRHSIGLNGGSETSRFFIGLGYQDQAGIMKNNNFKRISLRANSEFDVTKKFRIGENFQATYRQVLGQTGGNGGRGVSADENDILQAFRMPSIIPVYDEFGGYAGTAARGFNNPRNPIANRDGLENNRNFNANIFGNVYAEYDILDDLTFRTSIGGQYNNYYYWNYSRLQYENSENNSSFGYSEGSGFNFQWVFTNTLSWKKTFDKHAFDVILGQEALNNGSGRNIDASGQNPFSTDPDFITVSNLPVSSRQVNSGLFRGVNFASYFGRLNYTFNDKYLFSAVVRRDGSSVFGENSRYGVFPAFSAAWRISSESFLQSATWIDELKIRGGWGQMGNSNPVPSTNQFSLFGGDVGASSYDINGSNSSALIGFRRTRIGNPNTQWETAVTKNIGFDGTFFNGRLDIILDLWQKDTKDLLFQLPIPQTAGSNATPPFINIGQMKNAGVDLLVGVKGNLSSAFTYDLTVTASTLKNEIVALAPGLDVITSINPSYRGIQPIRNQVGQSLSAFFGYKVEGLFSSAEDVSNHAIQDGAAPGRFKFEDLDGDGEITPEDRTFIGSPVPDFTGGVNFTLGFKGLDLSVYLYTSIGNEIWNQSRWFTDFYQTFEGAAISERLKDAWTPNNLGAEIPVVEKTANFSTSNVGNSFYVEDGSYLRLQNITLGYTLPATLLEKWRLERVRMFASANNLFTLSGYSGLDPAVGGNADTTFGIDVGNYPVTTGYTFGLNLSF